MDNELAIYTTEELTEAFCFYLQGPKENRQLVDTLNKLKKELVDRPSLGAEHDAFVDAQLEKFYQEFNQ